MAASKKLKISKQSGGSSLTLQVNPSTVKKKQGIAYNHDAPMGALGSVGRFVRQTPETLKFNTAFDGTGVLENTQPVQDQLDALDELVYKYDGDKHEPNIVEILWGTELFVGRLQGLDREFTLYTPDGSPLRAKLDMTFVGYTSAKEQAQEANRSSPDLTHLVTVRAGDTLPALCLKIYRDSHYYPEIARINHLVNFRNLVPGTQLTFPPLK